MLTFANLRLTFVSSSSKYTCVCPGRRSASWGTRWRRWGGCRGRSGRVSRSSRSSSTAWAPSPATRSRSSTPSSLTDWKTIGYCVLEYLRINVKDYDYVIIITRHTSSCTGCHVCMQYCNNNALTLALAPYIHVYLEDDNQKFSPLVLVRYT